MSDLQCPATFLLLRPDRVAALVDSLVDRHVALVCGEPGVAAVAGRLGDRLGVPVRALDRPLDGGWAGLTDVADLHRGETVVVVSEAAQADGLTELDIDADGARLRPPIP